ncbi:hypothetical protein [Arthrobacter sp. AFG20]|uniref:hypothetical protein n=1 Tax=Arthrobacter sp. AFG20 TaxID=1688671 RepID=UPI002155B4C6|nr:hypothetical protein [Arthrobacter sp. AFG20]
MSRTDALFLMIASAAAAVTTTALTVSGIVASAAGPVTLTLPVATTHQAASGLSVGATGHYTALDATIPVIPSGPAALLAWAGALNQLGILAVLALICLLAYRLRSEILFTRGSGWLLGAGGFVLALAGTVGQILDSIARSRLADLIGVNGRPPGEYYLFSFDFNVGPLVLGIALLLVAGVFEFGRKLQKDTEGLV